MSVPTLNVNYWIRDDGAIVYRRGKVFYIVEQEFIDQSRQVSFLAQIVSICSALPTAVCGALFRHGIIGLPLLLAVFVLSGILAYAYIRRGQRQLDAVLAHARILEEPFDPYGLSKEATNWRIAEDGTAAYRSNWKSKGVFLTSQQVETITRCKRARSTWKVGCVACVLFADGYWWSGRISSAVAACGFLLVVGFYCVAAHRLRLTEASIVAASPPAPDEAFDSPRISPRQLWRHATLALIRKIAFKTGFVRLLAVLFAVLTCFLMAGYGLRGLLMSFQVDQGRGIPLGAMVPVLAFLALGAVLSILVAALFQKFRAAK